jgi:DNA polymerase III epsilon subunit-like protein
MYLLVVDIETTGLPEDAGAAMIEFACALYSVERKNTLWQLGTVLDMKVDNPCEKLNGICDADMDDAILPQEFVPVLDTMLMNSPTIAAVVAHSDKLDEHFVMKSELTELFKTDTWINSVEFEYPNQRGSKRLAHLAADHGVFGMQTHRALDDVIMLCNVLSKLNNLEEQVQEALKPQGTWRSFQAFKNNHQAKEYGFRFTSEPSKMWIRKAPLDKVWPEDMPFRVKMIEKL